MTLTIALPGERTAALAAIARTKDLTVEEYARQVLEQDLAPGWLRHSWQRAGQAGLNQLSHGRDRGGNPRRTHSKCSAQLIKLERNDLNVVAHRNH